MDTLQPLGDQAALAGCRDERDALRLAAAVRRRAPPWLVDVVQAYTTVAVHFDLERIGYADVEAMLRGLELHTDAADDAALGASHVLPCCYELQQDLERSHGIRASLKSISVAIARRDFRGKRPRHELAARPETWRQAKWGSNAAWRVARAP